VDDRELVAGLAARAEGPLPPRPGFLPPMKLGSSFVGELGDSDAKQVVGVFGVATAQPVEAGDAPSIRMAIHRLPGGAAAVIVGGIDDPTDKIAEWAPFDMARARAMVDSLRCRPALEGRDLAALAYTASNLSWFAHEASFVATFDAERVAVMEVDQGAFVVVAKARFGPP
jgi:hypothetical protein